MRAFLGQRLEEVVHIGRPRVAGRTRQHARGPGVAEDLGLGVGVVLAKAHGTRHVHDLAHRHVAPGRAFQLRHVLRDQRLGVDAPFVGQLRGHQAGERFGDREQQVRRAGLHLVLVALEDHPPLVQHHDGVGIGAVQPLVHGDGLALVVVKAQAAQGHGRFGQGRGRRRAAPDVLRGLDFAQVLHHPAQLRIAVAVGHVHSLVGGRRKALHQPQLLQAHAVGRRQRGRCGGLCLGRHPAGQ